MYNCSFCAEIEKKNNEYNLYENILKKDFPDGRVFYETDHWLFMPTLGCFKEGYFLSVSKTHFLSLYHCDDSHIQDLAVKLGAIEKMHEKAYGSQFVFFEHGIVDNKYRSACCVDHSHIHFIPLNISLWSIITEKYDIKFFRLKGLTDIKQIVDSNRISSYLLLGDVDKNIYLIDATADIYPSQFFRQIVYNHFFPNTDGWDWRRFYNIEKMVLTFNKLKEVMNKNRYVR